MVRRLEQHEANPEKRGQIRQAAFREFRDHGYHTTTVDAICKAAGISKGSFYWHYNSKQEVFFDILETWSREVVEEVVEQFEGTVEGRDHFAAMAMALQREARRGRSIVPLWLEFAVWAREDRELQTRLARFFKQIRESIATILRPAVGARLNAKEQEALAATIFGAYSGLIIQELCDPVNVDSGRMVSRFLTVLAQGLGPRVAEDAVPTQEAIEGSVRGMVPPSSEEQGK